MDRRASGILLHPTSLPGAFGIGDLGFACEPFLDWLTTAGQQLWQVLPVGPTGLGDSPYNCVSAFAGNPLLISPERLVADDLLPASWLETGRHPTPSPEVDFSRVRSWKEGLLRESWRRFADRRPREIAAAFEEFVEAPEQASWLDDWSLFAALKDDLDGAAWDRWPTGIRQRRPAALAAARQRLEPQIAYQRYLQFLFDRHWFAVKAEAARRGLRIFGDIPIYVAVDSAEVWAHAELFELDSSGRPLKVAGVPPDYFSATGQRWGNPIYRWNRLAEDGYAWWIERLRANLRLVDLLRIDHFRGFAGYWEIAAEEPTAVHGRWVPGPGLEFFQAVQRALGELPLVAEDLGVITPDVVELRRVLGLPGMKVLQFGFDEIDSTHLPHRVADDSVYYTGTHDNDTVVGWFRQLDEPTRSRVLDYLGSRGEEIHWDMIRAVLTSTASLAVIPMQDVLGLAADARMNTPGAESGNWRWRLAPGSPGSGEARRLRRLTELSGRLPSAPDPGGQEI